MQHRSRHSSPRSAAGDRRQNPNNWSDRSNTTRPGDLWLLGRHRLLCGDATNPEVVDRLLAGCRPLIMVTDPPYGVSYDPTWRHRAGINKTKRTGKIANDHQVDWTPAWRLFPGDVAYVWHAGLHTAIVQRSLELAGFRLRAQIVWSKPRFVISRGHYHWQHEPALYVVRKGATATWRGDRKQRTVWQIDSKGEDKTHHGTQKPIECMARPLRNHGDAGDDVYDPFVGSGTTILAAEQLGRRCLAMELSPKYCDLAVARWEHATGARATRIAESRA